MIFIKIFQKLFELERERARSKGAFLAFVSSNNWDLAGRNCKKQVFLRFYTV
jgi:hypothetical protein